MAAHKPSSSAGTSEDTPSFVLIPGAGGQAWYWHLLAAELAGRGHDVVAVDLPAGDDSAGLSEYAETVVDAIGDRVRPILVAQSMGGCTAPLVCERVPVSLLVMLNAMVPSPGERPGDWWANTGHEQACREMAEREGRELGEGIDLISDFFHDVPAPVVAEAMAGGDLPQSGTPFEKPWPLAAWPEVPTKVLLSREDRFFPAEFIRRVALDRLGIVPDEMPGGHLVALSRPRELADRLEAYQAELLAH